MNLIRPNGTQPTLSYPILSYLIQSHLILSYLTSNLSNLILSHLISIQFSGGKDWGVSEAAHITPLLAIDDISTGAYVHGVLTYLLATFYLHCCTYILIIFLLYFIFYSYL